jgi:hypothetical protein
MSFQPRDPTYRYLMGWLYLYGAVAVALYFKGYWS